MNKVASILARKGITTIQVDANSSVVDALKIMAEKNVGSVIVMDGEKYLGIMTERDYSRKVALKGKSSAEVKVAEIMSSNLPAVSPEDTIEHCMHLMSDKNVRYMPVFENNKLVGIISMSDVVKQTILLQKETITQLESYIHSNL
jgi:CBS domain-containing protein